MVDSTHVSYYAPNGNQSPYFSTAPNQNNSGQYNFSSTPAYGDASDTQARSIKRQRSESLSWMDGFDETAMGLNTTKRIATDTEDWLSPVSKMSSNQMSNYYGSQDMNSYSTFMGNNSNSCDQSNGMMQQHMMGSQCPQKMSLSHNSNPSKPYKCTVPGCEKSYKNANGLKYHAAVS
jgi:hypothetical protein